MARGNDQAQCALGETDLRRRAAVEFEAVFLDAVAEDHAVLRHERDDLERLGGLDHAVDDLGAGGLAGERLADVEDEVTRFPVEAIFVADVLDLGFAATSPARSRRRRSGSSDSSRSSRRRSRR